MLKKIAVLLRISQDKDFYLPSVDIFNRQMCNIATPGLTNPFYLSSADFKCNNVTPVFAKKTYWNICNIATPVLASPSQVQHMLSTCLFYCRTGNWCLSTNCRNIQSSLSVQTCQFWSSCSWWKGNSCPSYYRTNNWIVYWLVIWWLGKYRNGNVTHGSIGLLGKYRSCNVTHV